MVQVLLLQTSVSCIARPLIDNQKDTCILHLSRCESVHQYILVNICLSIGLDQEDTRICHFAKLSLMDIHTGHFDRLRQQGKECSNMKYHKPHNCHYRSASPSISYSNQFVLQDRGRH
jgi:hypothetical protein